MLLLMPSNFDPGVIGSKLDGMNNSILNVLQRVTIVKF